MKTACGIVFIGFHIQNELSMILKIGFYEGLIFVFNSDFRHLKCSPLKYHMALNFYEILHAYINYFTLLSCHNTTSSIDLITNEKNKLYKLI